MKHHMTIFRHLLHTICQRNPGSYYDLKACISLCNKQRPEASPAEVIFSIGPLHRCICTLHAGHLHRWDVLDRKVLSPTVPLHQHPKTLLVFLLLPEEELRKTGRLMSRTRRNRRPRKDQFEARSPIREC